LGRESIKSLRGKAISIPTRGAGYLGQGRAVQGKGRSERVRDKTKAFLWKTLFGEGGSQGLGN